MKGCVIPHFDLLWLHQRGFTALPPHSSGFLFSLGYLLGEIFLWVHLKHWVTLEARLNALPESDGSFLALHKIQSHFGAELRPVKSPSFICWGRQEGRKEGRKERAAPTASSNDIDRLFIFPSSISHGRLANLSLSDPTRRISPFY